MKYLNTFLLACFAACSSHADLVAHWPLDADANDATGNGYNGSVVSGTVNFGQTGANASTGAAAAFPDNGHIDIPFDAALNSESFTVALWANAASTDGFASPVTSRDDVSGGVSTHGFILYNNNNGSWDFWTGDGDPGWDGMAGDAVTPNTWTHLAITYDAGTDTKTLWINGVASITDTIPQSGATQYSPNGTVEMEALHIGSGADSGESFYFDGLIDDVGLWNEALDGATIQSVMMNGIASGLPDPALVVANPLDLVLDGTVQQFEIPVNNGGQTQDLTVSAANFDGDPNFSVVTLPGSIAPNGSGNITISFDPAGANGAFEAILEITSDDSLTPTRTIVVRGSIHDPLLVSDETVDLDTGTSGSFIVTNNGATRPLNISQYNLNGPNADKFTTDGSPGAIAVGGNETVNIQFNAGGEEGSFTATLEIVSDDPLLPSTTVTLLANVPFAKPLIAWWPLDVDGTDASGNGFDGVVEGSPIAGPGANGATGGSLEFDGFSTRIDVPFDSALNPQDFTVTLWANAASTDGFASPITSRDDVAATSVHGYVLYNNSDGNWDFWTGGAGPSGSWNRVIGSPVTTDTWTHLAISYDSATMTKSLYINGVLDNSLVAGGLYSPNGTVEMENLHIGAGQDDGLNFWYTGKIDDIGLFRVALSSEEINTIMTSGVGGFTGAARALEITDIDLGPNPDEVTITFNSVSGASYIIERSTDLTAEAWEELTDSHASEGEVTTFTDFSVPANSPKLFYRVIRP